MDKDLPEGLHRTRSLRRSVTAHGAAAPRVRRWLANILVPVRLRLTLLIQGLADCGRRS